MISKTFTYTDPETKEELTETVYFHLHEADIAKTMLTKDGGVEGILRKISKSREIAETIELFDDFIRRSVGYRNERGKFVRTQQYAEEFMSSEAYSDLFLELVGTTEKAIEFIKGVLPEEIGKQVMKDMQEQIDSGQLELPGMSGALKVDKKFEDYTRDELLTMDQGHFDALVGTDIQKMPKEVLVIKMQRDLAAKAAEKAASKQS